MRDSGRVASSAENLGVCPDCGRPLAERPHALFGGRCPVVRVLWPPRAVVDAFWRGDVAAMIEAPLDEDGPA